MSDTVVDILSAKVENGVYTEVVRFTDENGKLRTETLKRKLIEKND